MTGLEETNVKVNPKFGMIVEDTFKLVKEVENWEDYVEDNTAEVIKTLWETQSMNDTMERLGMKYTTVRSHLIRAIDRISNKKTDFKRGGKSEQARELFELMEKTQNWHELVTDNEFEIANRFKEVKNFYELGRMLGLAPSNIAGTLYGTTQKIGVIGKIKQGMPQTERRDIDGRRQQV